MLYIKFQPNTCISSGLGEKDAFGDLSIFLQQRPFFILDQAEFYHSEAL